MHRHLPLPAALLLLLAPFSAAQPGEGRPEDDPFLRHTLRLEKRLESQERLLEQIATLLEDTVARAGRDRLARTRLEIQTALDGLGDRMARRAAEVDVLHRRTEELERKVEDLEAQKEILLERTDRQQAELEARSRQQELLRQDVEHLRGLVHEMRQARKKEAGKDEDKAKQDGR